VGAPIATRKAPSFEILPLGLGISQVGIGRVKILSWGFGVIFGGFASFLQLVAIFAVLFSTTHEETMFSLRHHLAQKFNHLFDLPTAF
jgi:hypothetical protein